MPVRLGDDRTYNIEIILDDDAVVRNVSTNPYLDGRRSSGKDYPYLLYLRFRELFNLGTTCYLPVLSKIVVLDKNDPLIQQWMQPAQQQGRCIPSISSVRVLSIR